MTGIKKLFFSLALSTSLGFASTANAQQLGDIVFLVDESGSVSGIQGSLQTNIVNIANELQVAGIDWRIAVGGFGANSGGNPRVVTGFTNSIAGVQTAVNSLISSGLNEFGLAAIAEATTDVDANYGALRPDAGYCVILLTDEDSDYVTSQAADRAAALAGLQNTGAGFIGVVDPSEVDTAGDYDALVAGTVPGAIFDVADYVANPDATNMAIIDTCINEIIRQVPYTLDIKPTSCPNPIKMKTKGNAVVPAAIVGSDLADVTQIDPATLRLEGCPVLRYNYEDVVATYDGGFSDPLSERDCTRARADGYTDLTLKFRRSCLAQRVHFSGRREVRLLTLTGKTYAGDDVELQDVVRLMR